jgi:hypothetical protein
MQGAKIMANINNADRLIEEDSKPEPKRKVRTPKSKKEKGEKNGKK